MKTIEEKNRMIAEFMGGEFKYAIFSEVDTWAVDLPWFDDPSGKSLYFVKHLKYHTSFDWLMPVWSKLYLTASQLSPDREWRFLNITRNFMYGININNLSVCHQAVYDAIQLHNEGQDH